MSALDRGRRAALLRIGWGGVCALFGGVLAGSRSSRSEPGTPAIADDFRGIRVAAPGQASFTRTAIAGVCRLDGSSAGLPAEWRNAMLIVATDARRKEVFVAPATITRGRFATNLAESLPAREARYDVYAILGPYRSNVVRVSVSQGSWRSALRGTVSRTSLKDQA